MDKNKELAKNTAIITVGKICTQFMSFFLMPLYTTVLSTEEYGIVDLVVTYTSLLIPVILFEVDQALFRFLMDVRKEEKSTKEILSTACLFGLFQMLVAISIFSVLQIFVVNEYKWFLMVNVLGAISSNLMLQSARGLGKNTIYAIGSFISATSQIIGNIVFLLLFKLGVEGMLIATIAAHFITSLFIFVKLKLHRYISFKYFKRATLKNILEYSVPLIPNQLCWWILNVSDRTIVLLFLGTSFNGLLSVAHKFSSMYITFYNIFNLSWTESASLHINDNDNEEFFTGVITNIFKLFICAGIGIIACMPFAFPMLINSKFSGAYGVIPVFMLASMFNVFVGLYSVIYVALKKTKEIAKTSIYSGLINVVVHFVLVRWIGLYAAAVSTAIAFAIMALYRYYDLKKYINVKIPCKYLVLTVLMYGVTTACYYSNNMFLQLMILIIDAFISLYINKTFLLEGIIIVKHQFKK